MKSLIQPEFRAQANDLTVHYKVPFSTNEGGFHSTLHKINTTLLMGREDHFTQNLPIIHGIREKNGTFHMSYPLSLIEEGNIPQLLSVISFPQNALQTNELNITDIIWPNSLLASFPGPKWSIQELRSDHNNHNRALSCVRLLPELGISTKESLEKAYHIWTGGCDMVIESSSIVAKDIMSFQERLNYIRKERDSCQKRTKEKKIYIPNITGGNLEDSHQRLETVKQEQLHFCCINEEVGLSCLSSIIEKASRNHISVFILETKRNPYLLDHHLRAIIYRMIGASGVQLSSENKECVSQLQSDLIQNRFPCASSFPIIEIQNSLKKIEEKTKQYGENLIFLGSSQVYLHPDGIKAGSHAFHSAVCAASQGIDQSSAAQQHDSLQKALQNEQRISEVSM